MRELDEFKALLKRMGVHHSEFDTRRTCPFDGTTLCVGQTVFFFDKQGCYRGHEGDGNSEYESREGPLPTV